MSTNFEVVLPRTEACCVHCPRRSTGEQRIHIGKRWANGGGEVTFTLRAYTEYHEEIASLGCDISSWADWKQVLAEPGVMVRSEYGVVFTPGEFIAEVENSKRDTTHTSEPYAIADLDDGFILFTQEFS